jgi:hypothetical protein
MSLSKLALKIKLPEEWKRIDGFSRYEISSWGKVKSHTKKVPFIMKWRYNKNAKYKYPFVGLHGNDKYQNNSIHQLVAKHFIPNPDNLPEVRHLDGNSNNPYIGNLAWGTHQQNMKDKSNNTSKYTGVSKISDNQWRARINIDGKDIHIGCYDTEEKAHDAYVKYKLDHGIDRPYDI